MSDTRTYPPAHAPEREYQHHQHDDGHHDHPALLTAQDRHDHEAQTYDAMAAELLATWSDQDFLVDPAKIPFANREHIDYLTDAVDQIRPLAGKRILEVGAGGGSLAVWLAQQGAEVVGIDVSAGILQVAQKRAEINDVDDRTTFIHSPIETFDPRAHGLDDDTFDAIIGNNVVHHFERDEAMASLSRLLAPGAVAVFCEPVLFVPEWIRRIRYSGPVARRYPPHVHTPDERSLTAADFAIMRRWFRHVQWKPFQVLSRLQNFIELSDPVWNSLEAIDRRILKSIPPASKVCRMVVVTLGLPRKSAP